MATIRSGKQGFAHEMVDMGSTSDSSSIDGKMSKSSNSTDSLVRYEDYDTEFMRVQEPVVASMEDIALKALHTGASTLDHSHRRLSMGQKIITLHVAWLLPFKSLSCIPTDYIR